MGIHGSHSALTEQDSFEGSVEEERQAAEQDNDAGRGETRAQASQPASLYGHQPGRRPVLLI